MCLCGAFMMYARRTINVISKIDRVRRNYSVNLLAVALSQNVSKVIDNMVGGDLRHRLCTSTTLVIDVSFNS